MKKLIINNPGFEYLEKGFKEWLDVLGSVPCVTFYVGRTSDKVKYVVFSRSCTP